ncbi:Asp23/Gls24 family envelope stress response protein [Eggerthellaceae bacterium zg-1084]|uniref:Asp23/Gls24 family envelope stress response protein n=1 Tax=Berryella wangjianweii TaxID=2734634 RepID=A0A6M8IXV8_9ACTN|nr:Asp23/Gls24 family envelope stress response protein [Berryella wangjianweii]NPD30842.1 Asp23/Gls24 family envelope stress response protein [Berryella wangjianweii]NPD31709.1 Asp23/Gls24 family envelope stress response protein [Eggerthellaceae bacterium zg-997]QKF07685.1 Asp23/Gls24 family envelope stress response protein [Berryella wangjianweii]
MSDLHVEGMGVATNVVETIVSIAASSVEGVAGVDAGAPHGVRALLRTRPVTQGIRVEEAEDGSLHVSVRIVAQYGTVLPDLAKEVREAIADAVSTQVGATVGTVDVYIDGIRFDR